MAWSPLQELVTLDQVKQRLKLPLDHVEEDDDLQLQLEIAHEVCMDFIAQRVSGLAAWQTTADAWTATTVPRRVKGAILAQTVWLYRFRGDDTDTPERNQGAAICPESAALADAPPGSGAVMTPLPRSPCGTVICLASGPSLAAEDVAYVRGKGTVIAVNDAVQLSPWADVLYSSDAAWWQRHKWMPDFAGVRVMVDPIRAHKPYRPGAVDHGVLVLKNTGKEGIERSPDGLRTAINSGGAAINLAVHLGAQRIILLGYDMGRLNKKSHFHDNGPTPSYSPYDVFIRLIATMAAPLAAAGISVVNCSRLSALTCFPRMALAEALPDRMAVALVSVGTMRHYVRVRVPVLADDGEGGQAVTWSDGLGLRADIQPVSAREQAIAGAVQVIASHRVTTHYVDCLTVERRIARVSPVGSELQILGIRDSGGRQRMLELDCAEVV